MNTGTTSQRAHKHLTSRNPVASAFQSVRDRLRRPNSQSPELSDGYNNWKNQCDQQEADRRPGANGKYSQSRQGLFKNFQSDTDLPTDVNWHCKFYERTGSPPIFPGYEDQTMLQGWRPVRYTRDVLASMLPVLLLRHRFPQGIFKENGNEITRHHPLFPIRSHLYSTWPIKDISWSTTGNQFSPWSKSKMFQYRSSPLPGNRDLAEPIPSYEDSFPQWLSGGQTPPDSETLVTPTQMKPNLFKFKFPKASSKPLSQSTPPPRWAYIVKEDAKLLKHAIDGLAGGKSVFQVAAEKGAIQQKLISIRNLVEKEGQHYVDECATYCVRIIDASHATAESVTQNINNSDDELKDHYQRNAEQCRRHADGAMRVMLQLKAYQEEVHTNLEGLETTYQQYQVNEDYDAEAFTRKAAGILNCGAVMRQYMQQIVNRHDRAIRCTETYQEMLERTNRGQLV